MIYLERILLETVTKTVVSVSAKTLTRRNNYIEKFDVKNNKIKILTHDPETVAFSLEKNINNYTYIII